MLVNKSQNRPLNLSIRLAFAEAYQVLSNYLNSPNSFENGIKEGFPWSSLLSMKNKRNVLIINLQQRKLKHIYINLTFHLPNIATLDSAVYEI